MPLPLGSWSISTDGLGAGTLAIASVDAGGNISGSTTVPVSGPLVGFFDAGSRTVQLSNVTDPSETFIVFTATFIQVTSGSQKTQTTTDSVLAGTYETYPPSSAASAGRWAASLNQKVKEKDKEEKEKEHSKESKDSKDHKDTKDQKEKEPPDKLPELASLHGDSASMMQQLAFRLDAVEQRLATGQPFIGAEDRPPVAVQALAAGEDGNTG